jgi:hypothetical protein
MNRFSLLVLLLCLAGAACLRAAEPMSFQEISLMVRTGEAPQSIVNEAARRKLLMALTPDQEAKLQANGAPPALIAVLRTPTLLASPAELQAYVSRRQTQAQAAIADEQATARATPPPRQAIVLPDRFAESLETAKSAPARAMSQNDAFTPEQLSDAIARARSERKQIGFVIVNKKCFGQAYTTRQTSPYAALRHFYEAFKEPLVLVFVPNEGPVPIPEAAVRGVKAAAGSGLNVPYMVVLDAGATELVGVIPSGDLKADGEKRDDLFKVGAGKLQEWLSYHPTALSNGPPQPPAPSPAQASAPAP